MPPSATLAPRSAEHPRGATEVAPAPKDDATDMVGAWVAASAADAARRMAAPAAEAKPKLVPFDPFPDPPAGPPSFWSELKRREVPEGIVVYTVIALGVLQAVFVIIPALSLPAWLWNASMIAALVGLPIALILDWLYDLTPEGVRREAAPDHVGFLPPPARWPRLLALVGIAFVLALVSFGMWLRVFGGA